MATDEYELLIFEYWDVPEENIPRFLDYYENVVYPALCHCHGYAGFILLARHEAEMNMFGTTGRRKVITRHPGMTTLGVRTDAMIDFDALLQHEYNFAGIQHFRDKEILKTLLDDYVAGWEKVQPNWREANLDLDDPWDVMIRDFFGLCNNHWDVFYEVTTQKVNHPR